MTTDLLKGIKELWHVPTGRLIFGGNNTKLLEIDEYFNHYDGRIEGIESLACLNDEIFLQFNNNCKGTIFDIGAIAEEYRWYGAYSPKMQKSLYRISSWIEKVIYINKDELYMVGLGTGSYANRIYIIDCRTGEELWKIDPTYTRCYIGVGFGKVVVFDEQFTIKIYDIKTKTLVKTINLKYPNTLSDSAYSSSDIDVNYCFVNSESTVIAYDSIYDLNSGEIIGEHKNSSYVISFNTIYWVDTNYVMTYAPGTRIVKANKSDLSAVATYDIGTQLEQQHSISVSSIDSSIINIENDVYFTNFYNTRESFSLSYNLNTGTIKKFYDHSAYFYNGNKVRFLFEDNIQTRYIVVEKV